jgi:hypothetical protein
MRLWCRGRHGKMKEKRETVYVKADRNSICHDPQVKIMM